MGHRKLVRAAAGASSFSYFIIKYLPARLIADVLQVTNICQNPGSEHLSYCFWWRFHDSRVPQLSRLTDVFCSLPAGVANLSPSVLSRPMQRKLVTLVNCQLVEEEGRVRAVRAARSLRERAVTELILQHQNPQQLSANLWAAVRARGCQFLGPGECAWCTDGLNYSNNGTPLFIIMVSPCCSWCPVMITHRADSDWERVSHRDNRTSSLKSLRTPVWVRNTSACHLDLYAQLSSSARLVTLPSSFHTCCFHSLHLSPLNVPQLCRKTHWSWFCWLWRMVRLCPGRSWFCLLSRSSKLGSLRRPKPALATWCSCSTGPPASRYNRSI